MGKTSRRELVYQLKITLRGSSPPIWRRVQTPASTTFELVYAIIEASMDWRFSTLHEFGVGPIVMGDCVTPDHYPGFDFADEVRTTLGDVNLPEGDSFECDCQHGDSSWNLDVQIEKVTECVSGVQYPRCIDAVNAAPPAWIGGLDRYYKMIRVIQDPSHPSYKHFLKAMDGFLMDGGKWDPEAVDLEQINERLQNVRRWVWSR